jgi:acyl-CoA synthetase (AMP-forming)/AMP-acid ligase II
VVARVGRVPLRYHGDPVKSAATFPVIDGRRHAVTGDMGRTEPDGTVTVLGRGSQCINTGGEKVFAEEVEEVLRRHPEVRDALVVGAPDPRWGQAVVALVESLGRDTDVEVLRSHCRDALAGFKVPKRVIEVDEVQRTPAGKPDYVWARAVASRTEHAGVAR